MSIFLGDPKITTGYYIWKSMIPALLGNIVGGGLMVGTMYWYLNLTGEAPISVDGVQFESESAPLVGQGANTDTPTRRESSSESKKESPEDMV